MPLPPPLSLSLSLSLKLPVRTKYATVLVIIVHHAEVRVAQTSMVFIFEKPLIFGLQALWCTLVAAMLLLRVYNKQLIPLPQAFLSFCAMTTAATSMSE